MTPLRWTLGMIRWGSIYNFFSANRTTGYSVCHACPSTGGCMGSKDTRDLRDAETLLLLHTFHRSGEPFIFWRLLQLIDGNNALTVHWMKLHTRKGTNSLTLLGQHEFYVCLEGYCCFLFLYTDDVFYTYHHTSIE